MLLECLWRSFWEFCDGLVLGVPVSVELLVLGIFSWSAICAGACDSGSCGSVC